MHPRGAEIFYIIEGEYRFVLGNRLLNATTGDVVIIPKDAPNRFTVGSSGSSVDY
jgi:mannose-6-phosphate isomerase-like protein (cupin superfamily)